MRSYERKEEPPLVLSSGLMASPRAEALVAQLQQYKHTGTPGSETQHPS